MKHSFLSTLQLTVLFGLAALSAQTAQVVFRSDVHYWTTNYAAGNGPSSLSLANIRGLKTWRDLVVANRNDNTISVRLCRDAGNFNVTAIDYPVDSQPIAVIAADMNRDNYDDVVCANFGTNTISLLPNLKINTLGAATNYVVGTTPNPGPVALVAGRATQSGRQDIFVANLNENTVTVLTNAGNCVLLLRTNIAVGTGPTAITFADFNNDSAGDIVTANTNGTITILQGDGTGGFTFYTNVTLFPGGDPQPVAIDYGDFNHDGRIDLVTANYASNSITVLTNDMGTNFIVAASYDVGTNPRGLLVRDVNRDGIPDVLVANENSANIHVFTGNTNGTFTLANVTTVGTNPIAIAASNFNSDGMNDLAVACYGDNNVAILLYDLPLVFNNTTTAFEDSPKVVTALGQQVNNLPLTYSVVSSPAHGALTGSGPSYTYTPETNYFGLDSFTYTVNDGANDSATATNLLNILGINDAPSFTLSTNVIRAQKFALLNYSNFVASRDAGAANESGQKISYIVQSLSVSNLFLTRPTIQTNGTLAFKPSTNNFGTSTVTVIAQDSGGKSYGGSNQSPSQTFTIENPGPNPFLTAKGYYSGVFSDAGGVSSDSSGAFNFTMSNIGAYSGSLYVRGSRYSFTGQFDITGASHCAITTATASFTLDFQLDLINDTDRITGTVATTTWTAVLLGDKLTFNALTNPAPQAGKYTLLLPGITGSTDYPNGDSYGQITITTAGKVSFGGTLADNALASQTSYLSKNGAIPFYASIYGNLGSLTGWITITNDTANSLTGSLGWATGSYYVFGWATNVAISGSTYVPPPLGTRIIDVTNVVITLRDGDLVSPITQNAVLKTNNTFSYTNNPRSFSLTFSPSAGTISGSFIHPVTAQRVTLKGSAFQKQKKVEGFFQGPTTGGHFEIAAP